MAIQVSGTEVISNSRVLSNVTGLKTVGGTAILGSGDIAVGGSTAFGAVGTYAWGRPANVTTYAIGATASGMVAITNAEGSSKNRGYWNGSSWVDSYSQASTSGTWRFMGAGSQWTGILGYAGLWVRIS